LDTHAHIFRRDLNIASSARYIPQYDAGLEDYLRELDIHGISHGVLVQPSFLGTDNSYLLAALRLHPNRLRGIVVVEPTVSPSELAAFGAAGVVGIRLNLFGKTIPDLASGPWAELVVRIAALGWQVEVQREACDLPLIVGPLLAAGVNVVVDHFGRPDPALGADDPGFRYLLEQGSTGRLWVKLSGAYRNGAGLRGDRIAIAAIPLLRQSLGVTRLLWGSDWPHTRFENAVNYGATVAAFNRWVPDADEREVILRQSPAGLFRLGAIAVP
jgi:predicted TIM-barrel fold metal-dependent hydrolase